MVIDFVERRKDRESSIEITDTDMTAIHWFVNVMGSRGVCMEASRDRAEDGRSYVVISHLDDPDRFWQVTRGPGGSWVILNTSFVVMQCAPTIDALLSHFIGQTRCTVALGGLHG